MFPFVLKAIFIDSEIHYVGAHFLHVALSQQQWHSPLFSDRLAVDF